MIPLFLAASLSVAVPRVPASHPPRAVQDRIPWFAGDLEAALAEAKSRDKIVLGFFFAEANEACAAMSRTTFSDDRVIAALADVLCARVDIHKQSHLAIRYTVRDVPAILWFNPDGTTRDRTDDKQVPDAFLTEAARIKADLGTINELRRKVASKEDDVEGRFELYRRLRAVGDWKGAHEQKTAIIRLDPESRSRAQRHFRYEEITTEIERHWSETGKLLMPKVEELQLFVEIQTDSELVWDGWMRLANTHEYLANQAGSAGQAEQAKKHRATRRDFLSRAWRGIPEDPATLRWWCFPNAELFWNQREELSAEDKEFFMKLTGRMVQLFEGEALVHDLRARALMLAGKRQEALEAARKAVELEPTNQEFQKRLGEIGGG